MIRADAWGWTNIVLLVVLCSLLSAVAVAAGDRAADAPALTVVQSGGRP
jgi:hypothetical protein